MGKARLVLGLVQNPGFLRVPRSFPKSASAALRATSSVHRAASPSVASMVLGTDPGSPCLTSKGTLVAV